MKVSEPCTVPDICGLIVSTYSADASRLRELSDAEAVRPLGVEEGGTLHVGDRFTVTGNDAQVRGFCSILWVANPDETAFYVKILVRDMNAVEKARKEDKELTKKA